MYVVAITSRQGKQRFPMYLNRKHGWCEWGTRDEAIRYATEREAKTAMEQVTGRCLRIEAV